jgi:hypothetical protein
MAINEGTEHAEKTTGHVTAKALLAVIRSACGDSIGIHGDAPTDRASYSDSFVFSVSAKRRDTENYKTGVKTVYPRQEISLPGTVHGGTTSDRKRHEREAERMGSSYLDARVWHTYSEPFRPAKGFWYLCCTELATDALELLPADAQVSLEVYLDAGTNEYHIMSEGTMSERYPFSGLHTDYLYLVAEYQVRGKRKMRRFLIDTHSGPHNSARFGVR